MNLAVVVVLLLLAVIGYVAVFLHRQVNWDRGGLMERRGPKIP